MIQLNELLKIMVSNNASDLHIKPMRPPLLRKDGVLRPLDSAILKPSEIEETLKSILKERHLRELDEKQAVDVGYSVPGISRFRVNIFVQRGTFGAVFRRIPIKIPSIDEWGLPEVLKEMTMLNQGLVLVTGPTGSGKSSTLAAMIRQINETRPAHILTIEDPIEFLFRDKIAAITQREIGMDTPTFQQALRNALRQDPDIIMVGEMRDLATMETGITAAETGHLVLSTLHTNSASQSIDRILDCFPANQQKLVRMQLSQVIQAILTLKLLPHINGEGRIAAIEICRNSPMVCKLIAENRITDIDEEMAKSVNYYRMQTMNQSLVALVVNGQISYEVAMKNSFNSEELDLMLRKIFYANSDEDGKMGTSHGDYSKIQELLENQNLVTELQEKLRFEVDTRQNRINDLETELNQTESRLQQAFQQLDRLLKEKEQIKADKDKLRELYEKKISQMRKQFQERLGMKK